VVIASLKQLRFGPYALIGDCIRVSAMLGFKKRTVQVCLHPSVRSPTLRRLNIQHADWQALV
jgi:hypothetical protein